MLLRLHACQLSSCPEIPKISLSVSFYLFSLSELNSTAKGFSSQMEESALWVCSLSFVFFVDYQCLRAAVQRPDSTKTSMNGSFSPPVRCLKSVDRGSATPSVSLLKTSAILKRCLAISLSAELKLFFYLKVIFNKNKKQTNKQWVKTSSIPAIYNQTFLLFFSLFLHSFPALPPLPRTTG